MDGECRRGPPTAVSGSRVVLIFRISIALIVALIQRSPTSSPGPNLALGEHAMFIRVLHPPRTGEGPADPSPVLRALIRVHASPMAIGP